MEEKPTLLLLLGDQSDGFLSSLEKSVTFFSSFIIHDVAAQSYLDDVLRILGSLSGAHAKRSWKGEVQNRQDLVNLLPPGKMGFLTDSLTDLHPIAAGGDASARSDIYRVSYTSQGNNFTKATMFRGGQGYLVSNYDYSQVIVDEIELYPTWNALQMSRDISTL